MKWSPLGSVQPDQLVDMRIQMHYAAMLVASPAHTLLAHREDYSEDALTWMDDRNALRSEETLGLTCLLAPAEGQLWLSAEHGAAEHFSLDGLRFDEARRRLAEIAARRLGRDLNLRLPIEDYGEEMPEHGLRHAEPFGWDMAAAHEIGLYYANAAAAITMATKSQKGRSALRLWPHHFDMAVLITYAGHEPARYVGVGFSPGDADYPGGYFYVNPWPAPSPDAELPKLPNGSHWHRQGWTGAVLPATAIVGSSDQQGLVGSYLENAIDTSKRLLRV